MNIQQTRPSRECKASVLLVCRSYPPIIGGSEIEAQRICTALHKRGHDVEVVCCGGGPMPPARRWTDPSGVPVQQYGLGNGRAADCAYTLGVIRTILAGSRRFDVVYFLMPGLHLAAALPVARLLGRKIIMKFSGSNEVRKLLSSRIGRFELAVLRRWADRIMVLNPGMREEAAEAALPADRIVWMPNPVDTDEFAPVNPVERESIRQELGLPLHVPLAVFSGRLAPEKELPSIVAGFAHAARTLPEAMLLIVGDGPMRRILEEQTRGLGISERVVFAGMLEPAEVKRRLQAADVFVLASSLEGLPVSLIEAMSISLPSVVSNIPAMLQVITPGRHGLVTPLRDEVAIGAALLELFLDSSRRAQMGAAARALAMERFSTKTVVARYEAMFAELLGADG